MAQLSNVFQQMQGGGQQGRQMPGQPSFLGSPQAQRAADFAASPGGQIVTKAALSLIPGGSIVGAALPELVALSRATGVGGASSPHLSGLSLRERHNQQAHGHHHGRHQGGGHHGGKHHEETQQELSEVESVHIDRAAQKLANEEYYDQDAKVSVIATQTLATTLSLSNTSFVMPFEMWVDYIIVPAGASGIIITSLSIGGQPLVFNGNVGANDNDPTAAIMYGARRLDMVLKQSQPISVAITNLSAGTLVTGVYLKGKGRVAARSHPGQG